MSIISIVTPLFNEQSNIKEFYKRCLNVINQLDIEYEIIFVDDGCEDSTFKITKEIAEKDKNVKIISFSRNFGHQLAITAGMDNSQGDAVVVIDGDLQDPPELIRDMINKWREGYHVVYAKRLKRKGEGLFKKYTAFIFYRIIKSLTDTDIPVDTGDFRLLDRQVLDALKLLKEKNRFVRGLVSWVGFKQTYVLFERDERYTGKSKYPLKKMLRFAFNGIFSFSDKPLKIATVLGLFSSFIGFLLILWGLYSKLFLAESVIKGWTSVFISVVFLGGIQLFTIGIIGEYISRIYEEVKGRPLYIIKEKVNI